MMAIEFGDGIEVQAHYNPSDLEEERMFILRSSSAKAVLTLGLSINDALAITTCILETLNVEQVCRKEGLKIILETFHKKVQNGAIE